MVIWFTPRLWFIELENLVDIGQQKGYYNYLLFAILSVTYTCKNWKQNGKSESCNKGF